MTSESTIEQDSPVGLKAGSYQDQIAYISSAVGDTDKFQGQNRSNDAVMSYKSSPISYSSSFGSASPSMRKGKRKGKFRRAISSIGSSVSLSSARSGESTTFRFSEEQLHTLQAQWSSKEAELLNQVKSLQTEVEAARTAVVAGRINMELCVASLQEVERGRAEQLRTFLRLQGKMEARMLAILILFAFASCTLARGWTDMLLHTYAAMAALIAGLLHSSKTHKRALTAELKVPKLDFSAPKVPNAALVPPESIPTEKVKITEQALSGDSSITAVQVGDVEDRTANNNSGIPKYGVTEYFEQQATFYKQEIDSLDAKESQALDQMRQHFAALSCVEIDEKMGGTFRLNDPTFLRFLRARDFEFEKSKSMLMDHLKWRDEILPAAVKIDDIRKGLEGGMVRSIGETIDKRPILLVQVKLFNPPDFDSTKKFVQTCSYIFERTVKRMPPNVEKCLVFIDMAGFSLYRHWNVKAVKLILAFVKVVQDHNPERLSKMLLFNPPGVFQIAWKVIRKLLDKNVIEKVVFVYDNNTLHSEIDPALLMERYGGTRTVEFPIDGVETE